MGHIWLYLIALLAFLVIDAIALKFFMYPLFSRHVGHLFRADVQLVVALGFYVLFVVGILHFAVLPGLEAGSLGRAVLNGAFLGFLAYGTYESTNMATIEGWSWTMVVADISWGTILSAVVAGIGYLAGRHLI